MMLSILHVRELGTSFFFIFYFKFLFRYNNRCFLESPLDFQYQSMYLNTAPSLFISSVSGTFSYLIHHLSCVNINHIYVNNTKLLLRVQVLISESNSGAIVMSSTYSTN